MKYVELFDFVCLTETFVDSDFDYSRMFTDHLKYPVPAKSLSKKGRDSGGLLLLIRKCYERYVTHVKINCENTIAVRVKKSLFNVDKDILIIATYVAPENSPLYKDNAQKDGIVLLEESLSEFLNGKDMYFLMFGDFNARTGNEQPAWSETPNYSLRWDDDDEEDNNDCRLNRHSKDTVINNFGSSLLNLCLLSDFVIVNGACADDVDGEFTYVSPHGNSVDDYFILSKELFSNRCNLQVSDRIDSWHLPVEFVWRNCLECRDGLISNESRENCIVWSEDSLVDYLQKLESHDFSCCIQEASQALLTNINTSIDIFIKGLHNAAASMIKTVGNKKERKTEWFDKECAQKKRTVKRYLRLFQRSKKQNLDYRNKYVDERKQYKQLLMLKKKDYDESRIKKLKQSASDPRTFWNTIRTVNRKSVLVNNISEDQWFEHFRKVFNTETPDLSQEEIQPEVACRMNHFSMIPFPKKKLYSV